MITTIVDSNATNGNGHAITKQQSYRASTLYTHITECHYCHILCFIYGYIGTQFVCSFQEDKCGIDSVRDLETAVINIVYVYMSMYDSHHQ